MIGPNIKPIPLVASSILIADSIFSLSGYMSEAKEYDDVFKIAEAIPKSKFQSILRFLTLDKSEK